MRFNDILQALKTPAGYGLVATGSAEGVLFLYHNVADYIGTAANPSPDATLDQCINDWDAENMREFVQALITLVVFFPATLLSLAYLKFSERRPANENPSNEGLALVRDMPPRQRSGIMLWPNIIYAAIVGGLFTNGLFGTPITLIQAMDTERFEKHYPNATVEQCYAQRQLENKNDLASTVLFIINGVLLGVCLYMILTLRSMRMRHRQQLPSAVEVTEEEKTGYNAAL